MQAWKDADPSITLTTADIASDGRFLLGCKVTQSGANYTYEYALQNLNSHRCAGSFSVPFPNGTSVSNTGFHDIFYHSGEPVTVDTDWTSTTNAADITWSGAAYSGTPPVYTMDLAGHDKVATFTAGTGNDRLGNVIRWGTMFNFRFTTTVAPALGSVQIGLGGRAPLRPSAWPCPPPAAPTMGASTGTCCVGTTCSISTPAACSGTFGTIVPPARRAPATPVPAACAACLHGDHRGWVQQRHLHLRWHLHADPLPRWLMLQHPWHLCGDHRAAGLQRHLHRRRHLLAQSLPCADRRLPRHQRHVQHLDPGRLRGYLSGHGVTCSITCPVVANNDACAMPITLCDGVTATGDNLAGTDVTVTCTTSNGDLWYTYTPTANATVTVETLAVAPATPSSACTRASAARLPGRLR